RRAARDVHAHSAPDRGVELPVEAVDVRVVDRSRRRGSAGRLARALDAGAGVGPSVLAGTTGVDRDALPEDQVPALGAGVVSVVRVRGAARIRGRGVIRRAPDPVTLVDNDEGRVF